MEKDPAVYHSHDIHIVRLRLFLCNAKGPEQGKKLRDTDPERRVSEGVLHFMSDRTLA